LLTKLQLRTTDLATCGLDRAPLGHARETVEERRFKRRVERAK